MKRNVYCLILFTCSSIWLSSCSDEPVVAKKQTSVNKNCRLMSMDYLKENGDPSWTEAYTYNADGKILIKTNYSDDNYYTNPSFNTGFTTYTYGTDGLLQRTDFSKSEDYQEFTLDENGNIVKTEDYQHNGSFYNKMTLLYTYNESNNLIKVELIPAGDSVAGTITRLEWSGNNLKKFEALNVYDGKVIRTKTYFDYDDKPNVYNGTKSSYFRRYNTGYFSRERVLSENNPSRIEETVDGFDAYEDFEYTDNGDGQIDRKGVDHWDQNNTYRFKTECD